MTRSLAADANRGRVALISGGGTGIGRATAHAFAASGARVAICGRRPEPLEAVREELDRSGAECLAFPCDLREPQQVAALLDATLERFGAIDVLVNNAGGQFTAPAEEVSPKGLRAIGRLNLDAAWELTREVREPLDDPGRGRADRLHRVLAAPRDPGLRPRGRDPRRAREPRLRTGAGVEPARDPRRLRRPRKHRDRGPRRLRRRGARGLAAAGAAGQAGPPQEVGETIAFLATDGGSYITGTSIVVDGGLDAWGQGEPPPAH